MIIAQEIIELHDKYLADPIWPDDTKLQYKNTHTILEFIEANHFFNTNLWNEEDLARRKKVSDTEIAKNKRAIDFFNQARNDFIEKIDDFILSNIPLLTEMRGKQNSETLGAMIDRLSILSLKIFHMAMQTKREDADDAHIQKCVNKLQILTKQRNDLGFCFNDLIKDCQNGSRHFKQYKQFKMYNDPNLNPKIYNEN
jgi:hypothetical protein